MANQRLNATVSIGGTVAKSLTRGINDTRGKIGELQGTIGKATRRQTMLSREIRQMGRQGMNVDALRREYARLGDEIDRARRQQRALQRLGDANVGGKFGSMVGDVGRLARNTTVAVGALGTSIFGVANSTAALGDKLAKTADSLGIQIGKYQELRYAAERSGVSTQKFDSNMQAFTKRLGEAAQGSGAAKDALEQLGLSAQALASMTPDEALDQVADRLQEVGSQTERVALISDLFSRQGIGMINMLKGGSEGLRQFGEDARRTGYILSEKAARDAETFQDKLLDTQLSLAGLKNIIGSDLMPVVSKMMAEFTGWLSENRAQVREWSVMFADRVKAAIPVIADLASGMGTVVSKIGSAIGTTARLVGGFDNLGVIVATVFASKAIFSVVSFGLALGQAAGAIFSLVGGLPALASGLGVVIGAVKAFGLALMTTPIGWIIAGVAAVAGAAYLIYKHWDAIGPWFASLWDGIKDMAGDAWDWMKAKLSWSPLEVVAGAWGGLKGWFGGLWDGVKEKAGVAWGWLKGLLDWSPKEMISSAWDGLSRWIAAPIEMAKASAGNLWEGVKTVFDWSPLGLIVNGWSSMASKVGEIAGDAKDMAGDAWDWMKAKLSWSPLEVVAGAWGGLKGWFGGLWDAITAAAGKALDWIAGKLEWVGSAFNKVRGWLSWGDDESPDGGSRPQIGAPNGQSVSLGGSRQDAEKRGQVASERALPRPSFKDASQQDQGLAERTREVVNNITNNLTLHVTRREGEVDGSYAQRIADMVMEQINERQQGALYDG